MLFECKNFKDKIVTILMGLGFIALYFFIGSLLSVVIESLPYSNTKFGLTIYGILMEIILVSLLVILGHKKIFKDFKNFKKEPKKYLKTAFVSWLIGFGIMMVTNLIINLCFTNGAIAANESTNREVLAALPIYSILAMCIAGPICEEVLFRLSFKNAFKHIVTYCLFTGIFFAGMHVINSLDSFTIASIIKNWRQLLFIIPYAGLGIMFSYAYYKTDNIFTSIIMHVFHNSLTVLMIFTAAGAI